VLRAFIGVVLVVMSGWRALSRKLVWSLSTWSARVPAYAIGGLSAYWLIKRTIAAV